MFIITLKEFLKGNNGNDNMECLVMSNKIKHNLLKLEDIRETINDVICFVTNERIINEEKEFQIKLVLNELLTNCFKYANPSVEQPVEMEIELGAQTLSLKIKDGGEGFDAHNWLEHLDEWDMERLYKGSGRGLLLAKQMASELMFSDKGNAVFAKIDLSK